MISNYRPLFFCYIIVVAFGCHKQLDLKPVSQLSAANFYTTEKDIEQAVVACYDGLQAKGEYGQNFLYFMEVSADNGKTSSVTNSGGIYGDFDLFRVTANNAVLDQTWKACYAGIQRCNIVINRIGAVGMSDSAKNIHIGEVKFIRALTYFNMLRIWGALPLVTKETEDPFDEFDHGRDDIAEVYNQVIKDLDDAALVLPVMHTAANTGRVTRGATLALLGKVYLTLQNYPAAITVLQQVVNSGTYQLLPFYADLFKISNKNNRESIFEIQFKKGSNGEGSAFANLFATDASILNGVGPALGDNVPTASFIDSFQAGDARRVATIGVANGKAYCKKFIDPSPAQNSDADNNFIVIRYADVLLMLAEALNEVSYDANGLAFDYVNQVRNRVALPDLTPALVSNQASFRWAVDKERRYELSFENHRWFDLVRSGRAVHVMNTAPVENGPLILSVNNLLFKIPQSQIDVKQGLIFQNP